MPEPARTPSRSGSRITPRQIAGIVIAALLALFILQNRGTVGIQLFSATLTAPLWLVLVVMVVLGGLIGFLLGRRAKGR